MTNETKTELLPAVVEPALTPEVLIAKAIQAGVSADTMERLLAMRTKLREEQAKEAFDRALADFQSECPQVKKTKQVFNKDGRTVRYRYAPLEHIIDQVKGALTKHGFSYTLDAIVEPGWVEAICVATHSQGHSKPSSFKVPVEKDAFMNEQQKFASALTFCKRYAFCNAFGILCCDEDDDSISASPQPDRQSAKSAPKSVVIPKGTKKELNEEQRRADLMAKLDKYAPGVDLKNYLIAYLKDFTDKDGKQRSWLLPNEDLSGLDNDKLELLVKGWKQLLPKLNEFASGLQDQGAEPTGGWQGATKTYFPDYEPLIEKGNSIECPRCKSPGYLETRQGNKITRRCEVCKLESHSISGTEQSAGEVLEQLEPKSRPIPENALSLAGTIMTITEKKGTKTDQQGKIQPWTRYGIKDNNGNWYNTFDKKLAQAAKEFMDSKQTCQFIYIETKFGKDLCDIQ